MGSLRITGLSVHQWDRHTYLLRPERLAEGSSGARPERDETWEVTDKGNRDNGAEGARLVLLLKEGGDSGFGVEELDVATSKRNEFIMI